MHDNEYKVIFSTGEKEILIAGSEKEARVLAQAAQIRKGNLWEDIRLVVFRDMTMEPRGSWLNVST